MSLKSRVPMVTRVIGAVLAAFLFVSAFGAFFGREDADDSGELVWMALLVLGAAGIVAGLTMLRERPIPGTVLLCVGAVLAGWAYFWFPPVLLVALLVVVGAVWSLRISSFDRRPRTNKPVEAG